jgi:hypothetical protein
MLAELAYRKSQERMQMLGRVRLLAPDIVLDVQSCRQ